MGCFLEGFRPDRSELSFSFFSSATYMSVGQVEAKVKLLAGSPSLSVSLLFVSTSLVSLLSFFLFCLLHILFILQSFRLLFSFFFLSVLQLKPVDTAELSSLPFLHPSPSPHPELTAPELLLGPVGACLNVLSGHGLCLSLCLSQGGTMSGIALGHIFSAPHLFQCFLLCYFVILFNFIFYSVPHFCS